MVWSFSLKRTGEVCISATGQLELKEINKNLEFMIYAMWELEYGITE